MKIIILIALLLTTNNILWAQKLVKFQFSDCLQNCESDSSKIHEINKKEGITIIRLRTYAPCNGNFEGGFGATKDTLNLKFWTKESGSYKDKKGRTYYIVEIADCDCIFDFEYHIKGLIRTVIDKKIKINNKTLREIDEKNIFIEPDDID